MNEQHITRLKKLLTKWNPLGERSIQISDLNNYEIEAIDILFHINKNDSVQRINKMISTILNQAFGLYVDPDKCILIAEQVHKMLKEK